MISGGIDVNYVIRLNSLIFEAKFDDDCKRSLENLYL